MLTVLLPSLPDKAEELKLCQPMKQKILFILLALFTATSLTAQKRYGIYSVAFYNLENLFDTDDDPNNSGDDAFLPNGAYQWTPEKYQQKLHNIAKVIGDMAREHCPGGPALIGVAEVENARVLEDLCNTDPIKSMGLKVVHYDSPDHRGIDTGLLYNPRLFHLISSQAHHTMREGRISHTRDILEVDGILAGEPVSILVNHWPSKYGGAEISDPLRANAARQARAWADSIRKANPAAKVIVVGDLNDNPNDKSCAEAFGAVRTQKATTKDGFFNATWPLYSKGIGTLCYQDVWGLYDQQMISGNLVGKDYSTLKFWKAQVFNPPYLITPTGKKKGYPLRSFDGNRWQNGFADHFPTITYYIKELK